MSPSPSLTDEYVVRRTSGLVAYLGELVERSSEQVRDTADDDTVWLDIYYKYLTGAAPGRLMEVRCPPVPEPPQPARPAVERYRRLETLSRRAAESSDTHELLFGMGLLTVPAGRRPVRRHLLTCPVELSVDVVTETARLLPSRTSGFRLEDRDFLTAEDGFAGDREAGARLAGQAADLAPAGPQAGAWLVEWKRRCWPGPLLIEEGVWAPVREPAGPVLTLSPALLLRPRNRGRLVEFYRRLADELRRPGAAAPLGLAQLVVAFEREEKLHWLGRTARASLLSDADPLLPLPSNAEQRRILEVLRTDTAAVVQGPPGTGKTHTIANLICALLADGQRVLVTSEKGQALRVLEDMLPPDVRTLCVLATGQRRGADDSLDRGITALAELRAGTDTAHLARTVDRLADQRRDLLRRRKSARLDLQVVREDQHSVHRHGATRYSGTLVDIVRAIEADRPAYEWIGDLPPTATATPALTDSEATTLLDLCRDGTPERAIRGRQRLPDLGLLPDPAEVGTAFTHLDRLDELLGPDRAGTAPLLNLDRQPLTDVVQLIRQAADSLAEVGLPELTAHWDSDDWRLDAVRDRLARQNPEYWATLRTELRAVVADPAVRAAAADTRVGVDPAADPARLLGQARRLRASLDRRHRVRRHRPGHPAERDAADLLTACTVDQAPPSTVAALEVAITHLHAAATVDAALRVWAATGNPAPAAGLRARLARLRDIERSVTAIDALTGVRDHIEDHLRRHGIRFSLRTPGQWDRTVRAVQAAPLAGRARAARDELGALHDRLSAIGHDPDAAPEIPHLITALRERDIAGYASGRAKVGRAILDHAREHRCADLTGRLRARHPALAARLLADPHHPAWDSRLAHLGAAWAWATAVRYQRVIAAAGGGDTERVLRDLETQLGTVTAQLAGHRALLHCLTNVSERQRAALQDYRTQMSAYGRGRSDHAERRLRAARSAMREAQAAVPAWIMPLGTVVETMDIRPGSFDVVIVDEASQAGIDALFLLCLAPRVIVVGDDRQCAPAPRTGPATVHDAIDHHLGALSEHVRESFSPVSNLYELLSARFPGVIRLTEHFRCMPEIIGWSSRQFYRDSLIPLRQFGADRLDPLQVVRVAGAVEEGPSANPRNPAEARAIVDRIQKLLIDPDYLSRSIGVVVLQGPAQAALIDAMVRGTIDPAEIQRHRIRVGQPPDFQGDERDVILLSMTIARPRRPQTGRVGERRFNVAASRARDQLWLFTSVDAVQLQPDDLRHSLLTWMQNPPVRTATDPRLDQAGRDELHPGFATLLQQHVFLDLRERDYTVIAQYPVSGSTVDLVVVGDDGRLAVECETPDRPATADQIHERLCRDQDLERAGWQFVRIKHSDYLTDAEAALRPLWAALRRRGIGPRVLPRAAPVWAAAPLSADEEGPGTDQEP